MGEWPDYYRVMHSLSRSRNRARILVYMYDHRDCPCIANDICRDLGLGSGVVAGALRGGSKKYREANSLVDLGLISYETDDNCSLRVYALTPQGMNVARLMKRHRYSM